MALPIIGPTVSDYYDGTVYTHRVRNKQSKPIDRILPYRTEGAKALGSWIGGDTPQHAASMHSIDDYSSLHWQQLLVKSYDQLKSKVHDRANLAMMLAERNQSMAMMRQRSIQMFRFGRQLLRGNLVGAAKELKMSTVPKGASTRKSFANNYLEFHFGWAPLVSDIYSAVDVLQSPIDDQFPKSSAKSVKDLTLEYYHQVTSDGVYHAHRYYHLQLRVRQGCRVVVSNPNLHLANQLGLVNPAILLYERVPFSFVADWFFNVEQFLSLGSDFLGLTLSWEYTTYSWKGSFDSLATNPWALQRKLHAEVWGVDRVSGLSTPGFVPRPLRIWGWRRVAAALSLVTQQLVKK